MTFKHIVAAVLIVALASIYVFINPSEVDFLPKCPFYLTTGFYCAGCGSQRATHQLLNFNFLGVLQQNLLYVFGLGVLLYHFSVISVNAIFKKHYYNYIYHPKTPIIILVIIIVFWICRNIPMYPFNLLAPK
ncbi:DUF2752 domain-containing protein [Lutibacter holmesii]|uniref:DUF2752 domain-containing protein n=1 Tax=Lutibacter holmesii TaxID=1137985 RepID=A0ABW3WRJ5_9FLAO